MSKYRVVRKNSGVSICRVNGDSIASPVIMEFKNRTELRDALIQMVAALTEPDIDMNTISTQEAVDQALEILNGS